MADAGKKKPHVPEVRPEWLALRHEAAVEPSLPIVDAHVHLWDFSTPPFFGADLVADASSGHDVTASVFIECMMAYAEDGQQELRPVGETRFVASQAQSASSTRHQVAAAIMGAADLALGDAVRPVLEAHVEAGAAAFVVSAPGPRGMPIPLRVMVPRQPRPRACCGRHRSSRGSGAWGGWG